VEQEGGGRAVGRLSEGSGRAAALNGHNGGQRSDGRAVGSLVRATELRDDRARIPGWDHRLDRDAVEIQPGLPTALGRIIAGVLLVLSLPLMLVIAVLIRLESPGPVIFRQMRIGQDRRRRSDRRRRRASGGHAGRERRRSERRAQDLPGRPFVFWKFRTMRNDSRQRYPQLFAFEGKEEALSSLYLQIPEDPRVSRLGRFLRRTSLDELPNFWNVLKGDIALVGPRPEMVEMARYYRTWERLKFKVKPGITGQAQVSGRGLLNFPETVRQDVDYVLRRSRWTDVRLLLKTVMAMIKGSGAL
jgi:lipopolysaccharide/colanic/teichoic acid biosynthesis glycosyltransferase